MVYFRPMRALGETSLTSVFHDLHLYLCRRCSLDISSQHLTVHLPRRVPVGERYSLLDLHFACAMMDTNMDVFFDDYRVLQLIVTTTRPSPSLSLERESALLLTDAIAGIEKLCGDLFAVIYLACSHFVCCALPTELWLKRRVESLSIDILLL